MSEKYHPFLRVLHWIVGPLIIIMLALGWCMENLLGKEDPIRPAAFDLHKSIGVVLLLLILMRIATRLSTAVPPLPGTMHPLIRISAKVTHYIIYVLMVLMPLTGYGMTNSFGYPVKLFGLPCPKIFPDDKAMGGIFRECHKIFGYALMILVTLHITAAIYHRFFDRQENNVLPRIT